MKAELVQRLTKVMFAIKKRAVIREHVTSLERWFINASRHHDFDKPHGGRPAAYSARDNWKDRRSIAPGNC